MNVGISVPLPAYLVDVGAMARAAEELGFESIWCAEHPIMPVTTTSKFPGSPDGAVPERNPLLLAKEISTLDLFSGGRFLFGIGTGWHREETTIMGGDFDHRWTQTREAILVMKELWTKKEAEYQGKYYVFPAVKSYPKPAQKPHPPVILGGHAANVLERIVEWGDGWLPNRATPEEVEGSRRKLDTLAKAAGRDPAKITISAFGQPADRDLVRRFHDAGATRVIVRPPTAESES